MGFLLPPLSKKIHFAEGRERERDGEEGGGGGGVFEVDLVFSSFYPRFFIMVFFFSHGGV